MIIDYPAKKLQSNPKLHDCIYFSDHDTLYKNCNESLSPPKNLAERILFVSGMGEIEGLIGPLNVLADNGEVYGYEMEYLKEYSTLQDLISSGRINQMSFKEKKLILLKLFKALREINKQYELGDINTSNIMIGKNDGKFIDFENGRPLGSHLPMLYKYHVLHVNGVQSDSIKMLVQAICMLYDLNIEYELMRVALKDFPDFAKYYKFDKSIISYLIDFNKISSLYGSDTLYFDEYLDSMLFLTPWHVNTVKKCFLER